MPVAKNVLNAFTASEVHEITGLSIAMIDYLAREGYLIPSYQRRRTRGRVRYYSYRDLVVAQTIQSLRETGVELARLKEAINILGCEEYRDKPGVASGRVLPWLVSDGNKVYLKSDDGFLDELRAGGQRAFAFVVSLENVKRGLKHRIPKMKRRYFSFEVRPLIFAKRNA